MSKTDAELRKDVTAELEWDPSINASAVGVTNLIALKPSVAPDNVATRIRDALTRHAQREANHIDVSVHGGVVSLRGKVGSWAERNAAFGAAWAAPGVTSVVNELTVEP